MSEPNNILKTYCSGCKQEINTIDDTYNSTPNDFMAVYLTCCCKEEPTTKLPISKKNRSTKGFALDE